MSDYDNFLKALAQRESSGNKRAINRRFRYIGLYQMGEEALIESGYIISDGKIDNKYKRYKWAGIDGIKSYIDFLDNVQAQTNAVTAFHKKTWGYLKHYGALPKIGTEVAGVCVTASGLLAAGHLVGGPTAGIWMAGPAPGKNIPKDGFETRAIEYLKLFAGYELGDQFPGSSSSDDGNAHTCKTPGSGADKAAEETQEATEKGGGNAGRSPPRDPFVLDLDGDGIELTDLEGSKAYFDLNGDGFATRTSWLSSDDAFLALDRNDDGTINDISELFGSPDRTGYSELSDLDSNADGVIDAKDERFADLKVWQDANGDGVSQAEELQSLTDAGIASIDLSHNTVDPQQNSDGQIARQGTFTWKDGRTGIAAETAGIAGDVLFSSDATFTRYVGDVTIKRKVLAVGNIKGYGQMPDLHIAMSLDKTLRSSALKLLKKPTAQTLVNQFESLLFDWAKVKDITIEKIDPNHRLNVDTETGLVTFSRAGESFTLPQLGLIKQYVGIDVLALGDGQWREDRQLVSTGGYYRQAYNVLTRNLLVKLAVANDLLSEVMPGLSYDATTDLLTISTGVNGQAFDNALTEIGKSLSHAETVTKQWLAVASLLEIDPSAQSTFAESVNRFINSYSGDNLAGLKAAFASPALGLLDMTFTFGTTGADHIQGKRGRDILLGGQGNDELTGREGDDSLVGSAGYVTFRGDASNDAFYGYEQRQQCSFWR